MTETPRPNFIFLAGDRYGWQPLPDTVPSELFERIMHAANAEERQLLSDAYKLDTNAIPTLYYLSFQYNPKLEANLLSALRKICDRMELSENDANILFPSATHRELLERLKKQDFPESAVCAIRTLKNVPLDKAATYYDALPDGNLDSNARRQAENLKHLVKKMTTQAIEYEIDLAADDQESALADFEERVYKQMEQYLIKEFLNASHNKLYSEEMYHEKKKEALHQYTTITDDEINPILTTILSKEKSSKGGLSKGFFRLFKKKETPPATPFAVITGGTGTGKTALIAEVCTRYQLAGNRAGKSVNRQG